MILYIAPREKTWDECSMTMIEHEFFYTRDRTTELVHAHELYLPENILRMPSAL
jgi:hypothetical protein